MRRTALLAVMSGFLATCWKDQEVQLPSSYRGWVVVRFSDPACKRDDARRIVVGADGVACLRSEFKGGYFRTSFRAGTQRLRRTDPGGGGQIWGEAIRRRQGQVDYVFFVGS